MRIARGTVQPQSTFIGDSGSTEELMETIKMLLTSPKTFQELLETGARPSRIKGVIMRLQREGTRVVNLGNRYRALWFIPTETTVQHLRNAGTGDTSTKKRGRPSKKTEPDLEFDTIRNRLLTLVNNPEQFRKFLEHSETQVSK